MVSGPIPRRHVLVGALAATVVPRAARGQRAIALDWHDLLPDGMFSTVTTPRGVIPHEGASLLAQQPASTGLRTDWNGRRVRLPGFVVPMEFDGTGVTTFLLVPFVGACIHVPPPPANQLVLVTPDRPFESGDLFEPVSVTGRIEAATADTALARIGYAMAADDVRAHP